MTMMPQSDPKTSQGIFSSQPQRQVVRTSRSRRLMQWSRHQRADLTSADCSTSAYKASRHRSEELTSEDSGTLCHNYIANAEEKKLTSAQADEAQDIADIEGEELTSASADEAQLTSASLLQADEATDDAADAYTDAITNAMHTTYLNDIHSTHCIARLRLRLLWPVHPECLSHFRLHLHLLSVPLSLLHMQDRALHHSGGSIRPLQLHHHKCVSLILALACHLAHPLRLHCLWQYRLLKIHLPLPRLQPQHIAICELQLRESQGEEDIEQPLGAQPLVLGHSSSTCINTRTTSSTTSSSSRYSLHFIFYMPTSTSTTSVSWSSRPTPVWVAIRIRCAPL